MKFTRLTSHLLSLAFMSASIFCHAGDCVWIEAEKPTALPTIPKSEKTPDAPGYELKGFGNLTYFSEGKGLHLEVPADETLKRLGKEGAVVGYDFEIDKPGKQDVWGRIGYEFARSDFDWRVDGGEWKKIPNTALTCDVMPIETWKELAWIKFGDAELAAGKHKVEIRNAFHEKREKAMDRPQRVLFLLDCLAVSSKPFVPNGKFKPGDDYGGERLAKAAANVFAMPAAKEPGERVSVNLTGDWRVARWDEQVVLDTERLAIQGTLPKLDTLNWYPIAVPGSRTKVLPEFDFSHRNIYLTKVDVPATLADRSFILDFESFNMIAGVFVNGVFCGFSKDFIAPWQCDVTSAVKPGQVNEIAVVLKDRYYAIAEDMDTLGCRKWFNLPAGMLSNQSVSMKFDMPVFGVDPVGILEPVALVAAGKVYVDDVFAKPSVKKKELGVEVSIRNPTSAPVKVKVECEVSPVEGGTLGKAEKSFAAKELEVGAGKTETFNLVEKFDNPKLWWPDDPKLYTVVTKVLLDGKVVDIDRTRFGFREWEWDSHLFKLNGVKWPMWADLSGFWHKDIKKHVEFCRSSGMNMTRYWHVGGWGDLTTRQSLDAFDELGLPVRRSGVFDGQLASYGLTSPSGASRVARQALFDNWYSQMRAWIKGERNHPSIFIWSVENEVVFINSCNLGSLDVVEPAIRKGAEIVEALDPTRPTMVDGGRALKNQSMPVNGCHYNDMTGMMGGWTPMDAAPGDKSVKPVTSTWRDFPDMAYNHREAWYKTFNRSTGVWPMAKNKPIFHGECFFAGGIAPAEYSAIDGEHCFVGMSESKNAKGLYGKMLSEGWRWDEVAAWHFWLGGESELYFNSWRPVCVLCREWNWTFPSAAEVKRTLKVFNNTRLSDPIEAAWSLIVDGKTVSDEKKSFDLPPGESKEYSVSFKTPSVADRATGEFILTCSRGGKEIFREVKKLSVLNPDTASKPAFKGKGLVVVDPHGSAKKRLAARGIPFTEVASIDAIPAGSEMVLVGKDAMPEDKDTNPTLLNLAGSGSKVIVLEQANPLHYQAVGADLDVTDYTGRIAFPEDMGHPLFTGLEQSDFFTWSKDHIVYRKAYKKATKGARSLLQCDNMLNYSAISEAMPGDGLLVLCQAVVGEKLDSDPVAKRLFDNMLSYAASYKPVRKLTSVCLDMESLRGKMLAESGLKYDAVADPLTALDAKYGVAVVDATPANLKTLAGASAKVKAFTEAGGWLMLWGLTPEGLADYNKTVGFDHSIRPFQMERVVFSSPRDPLTAGMTLRDVVMDSGKNIFNFMSLKFPAEDEFNYVVDYDEVGPFLKFPTPEELGKPKGSQLKGWDHWPLNMVNNYTSDDTWRFCYSIILDRGDKTKWTMELPKEEEVTNFSIVLNVIYHKVTRINLYFDDDPKPFTIETRPTHDRQDFAVQGRKCKKLTIELADWEKSGEQNVIGIDNFWVGVKRPEAFLKNVKPLLNIGGLMRYNMGKGGIVLNQLNVIDDETNPVNAEKKTAIAKTLLGNLGAVFSGGAVTPGARLKFTPVKFPDTGVFNAYFVREGKSPPWFTTHAKGDVSGIPSGVNKFGDAEYEINDFRTSPVPTCVMLKGHQSGAKEEAVREIPVKRKCDALFFLHAYNAHPGLFAWKPTERSPEPPVLFKYVVNYADGKSVDIPVSWRQDIGHWLDKKPGPCMNAVVGWSAPFANDASGDKATVYSMRWLNPRPDVAIETVDITLAADMDKWGAPAVMAISTAEVAK